MAVIANMEKLLTAAPLVRRPWGLLVDVATQLTDAEMSEGRANRVGMGVTWVPWGCDPMRRGNVACDVDWLVGTDAPEYTEDVLDEETVDMEKDAAMLGYPDVEVQSPFKLLDGLRCTTISMDADEMNERLRTRARAMTSSVLTRELVDGWASGGISLSSTAETLTAPFSGVDGAFAAVEAHLAEVLHGGQGVVHIPPAVLHLAGGYIMQEDGKLFTKTGHLVSADAGLDGSIGPGAAGASDYWIYATGPIAYHVTSPELLGGNELFVYKNLMEKFIEAMGIVVFDPCAVGAVILPTAD